MEQTRLGEIKQAIASLTSLVAATVDSTTQTLVFGEIKRELETLTNIVTSAIEGSQVELSREEKQRDGGSDQGEPESPLDRARARVRRILSESTFAHPLCLRCGGEGHYANQCHSSIVCFACERTGHKSRNCKMIAHSLKNQHKPHADSNHKVISFTVNFHIRRGDDHQGRDFSHWVWKRKEDQLHKNCVNQREARDGEEKNTLDGMKKNDVTEEHVTKRKNNNDSNEEVISTVMKSMIEMPVIMNTTSLEANGADNGETNVLAYDELMKEGQKEAKNSLNKGQKEIKEKEEAQKETSNKENSDKEEIAVENKVDGQSNIKPKRGKSKKKKKKEDQMEWLLTIGDQ